MDLNREKNVCYFSSDEKKCKKRLNNENFDYKNVEKG